MLTFPVDGHIVIRVDAVFTQQIAQSVFRCAALAGSHDGLALQVRHGLHGIAAFHDIQHAKGVHRQHLQRAVRFAVQHGGKVGGHAGHVQLALDEQGCHLIGGAGQGEFVGIAGGYHILLALHHLIDCVAQTHQFHQSHGGGAFQGGNFEGGGIIRRFRGLGRLLCLCGLVGLLRCGGFLAAGGQRQRQGQRQAQCQQFLFPVHIVSSFPMLSAGA